MQFSKIFSLAACLAFVHALPAPESRSAAVKVIFKGAAGAQYELTVPLDGRTVDTSQSLLLTVRCITNPIWLDNRLSVSSISSTFDIAKFCTLKTVDFPPALVEGPSGTWQVGPPQTVNSIACKAGVLSPSSIPTVNIQFNGAADAKYFLTVPLDNTVIPTRAFISSLSIV